MKSQFRLWSSEFSDNGKLSKIHEFNSLGGDGQNVSPKIDWSDVPDNTQSFALTIYDPDAPTGSGFWHWVIFNIPKSIRSLEQDAGNIATQLAPSETVQVLNDYGEPGFGGPCPPFGDEPNRYEFVLYALDTPKIELDKECTNALVRYYILQHAIENARIVAYYP